VPSRPHVEAADAAHWVAGVGAWPAGTGEQVPALPVSAHDWQVPAQAVAQQTPCAQIPDRQTDPDAQAEPFGNWPQLPLLHVFGETQSLLLAQVVLHAAVPQTYGAQGPVVAARHVPAPSQVRACVSVEPAHEAAPQTVPVG